MAFSIDTPHRSWIDNHDGPFLSHARMSWFYRYFIPPPITAEKLRNDDLSPLLKPNFRGLPASLVYPADIDVLSSEGIAYAKKLQEEGDGWVELVVAKDIPHSFPMQTGATPRAREFFAKAVQRLKDANEGNLKRE
jgi:acetyl esterase/lipase